MTVSLDQTVTVGPLQIRALSKRMITTQHRYGVVFVTGQKRPVAIFVKQGEALIAFGPEGNPMSREHIEILCPGAWRAALEGR